MNQGFEIYPLGQKVRVSTGAGFKVAATGELLDPDEVFLSVKPNAGTTITYKYGVDAIIERDSLGKFHADLDANEAGFWYFRWFSEGDGQAAAEERFKVEAANAV